MPLLAAMMLLQPIVYTNDMARAVAWYQIVLGTEPSFRSDAWTTFEVGDAILAIHHADTVPVGSRVGLSLVTTESLDGLIEVWSHLEDVELIRGIQEEPFGRSILIRDPDGVEIQVNQHH